MEYGTVSKWSDLALAGAELELISKKFPEGSIDREFLLALSKSLWQTHNLTYYLMQVRKGVDRINTVIVPEKINVLHLSLQLEATSESLATWQDHDGAKAAKQASELLSIWYDQYVPLAMLVHYTKPLTDLCERPAGSA